MHKSRREVIKTLKACYSQHGYYLFIMIRELNTSDQPPQKACRRDVSYLMGQVSDVCKAISIPDTCHIRNFCTQFCMQYILKTLNQQECNGLYPFIYNSLTWVTRSNNRLNIILQLRSARSWYHTHNGNDNNKRACTHLKSE